MDRLPDVKIAQFAALRVCGRAWWLQGRREAVFRSQPALSLSMKELEAALGVPLFEKGSHATPTPFGATFYGEAKKLVEHYERVIAAAVDCSARARRQRAGGRGAIHRT